MSQLEFIPVTINKNFITSKDASKDGLVIIFSPNEVLLLNNNFPTLNDLENYYFEIMILTISRIMNDY